MPLLPSRKPWSASRDRISLLAEQSPPPSPSPFRTSDSNVSSMFPSVHVAGATESFDDMRKNIREQQKHQSQHQKTLSSGFHPPRHRDYTATEQQQQQQRRSRHEMTASTGALQFVPAYEEATSLPSSSLERSPQPVSPNDSYDGEPQQHQRPRPSQQPAAISSAVTSSSNYQQPQPSERGIFRRKNARNTSTPSTVSNNTQTSSTATPTKQLTDKRKPPNNKQAGNSNKSNSNTSDDAVSAVSSSRGGKGTRIARLASMFSSRAVVKNMTDTPSTVVEQPSPSPQPVQQPHSKGTASPARSSEASSGYVGWPGTQDKRGGTVAIQSSYEESDVGASNVSRKHYHEELEAAVDRELTIWMDEERSDSSDPVSPARRSQNHRATVTSYNDKKHHQNDSPAKTSGSEEEGNPADFHLAAAVADAAAAASSPMAPMNNSRLQSSRIRLHQTNQQAQAQPQRQQHFRDRMMGGMSTPLNSRIKNVKDIYGDDPRLEELHEEHNVISPMSDPWGTNTSGDSLSSAGTSLSKTSSAYFSATNPDLLRSLATKGRDNYELNRDRQAILRMTPGGPQPPTEEMLALKDSFSPPLRTFNAANTIGYRGLLDKTKDVPNLMDGVESDSTTSRATSTHSSSANHSVPRRSTRPSAARGVNRLRASDELDEEILEDASSDIFDRMDKSTGSKGDASVPDSDVFDGLSNVGSTAFSSRGGPSPSMGTRGGGGVRDSYRNMGKSIPSENPGLNLVLLGGGLTTIQTTANDFSNRMTSDEFDETLTNSDYDQYGYAKIPAFSRMPSLGRTREDKSIQSDDSVLLSKESQMSLLPVHSQVYGPDHGPSRSMDNSATTGSDSGSSLFSDPYRKEAWGQNVHSDLSRYYVHPDEMKKVLQIFRRLCKSRSAEMSYDELERKEDATKAFALSEMRSRIMEKDIERGLERRGGTTVVDDLVLTPHHRASLRIRDAIVVSKAWRDGASPRDVMNTSLLTRRPERAFFIKRPISRGNSSRWASMSSGSGGSSDYIMAPRYTWEEVRWVDDTDFVQYQCPSLGPRHMRGFEMFSVGDCQSILLKLSNERCLELRAELNEATARQIEAEDMMKEEADPADGMMTEAEMTYLTTMEEVKTISHKLVIAEKAFTLVRDRIENLVSRYESLLVKMTSETESMAASSLISYESSYYSDGYSSSEEENRERGLLARRAERAELRAELAAREAMLAKQEARVLRHEKERELHVLQMRLNELQSESSAAINEKEQTASIVLARAITATRAGTPNAARPVGGRVNNNKARIEDVKKRFRDRTAAKHQGSPSSSGYGASPSTMSRNESPQLRGRQDAPQGNVRNTVYRTVGEEMFQHLDFYERSLKAVDGTR